jgi:neurocan core protein
MDAVEGQEFTTFCNATGKPAPVFTWVKQSTQQDLETADRFRVDKITGRLTIVNVQKEDNDAYTCIAQNAAGVSEVRTRINVLVRPNIYELINITKATDEEAILKCRAYGRPQPKVTFKRYGFESPFTIGLQPNDDRIVLENISEERDGVLHVTAILRISKLARTDDGLYECIASNRGDTAYKMGHIAVEYAPNFDYMKTLPPVYSWDERKANLSCLAEGFPNATIQWYLNEKPIAELYDKNIEIVGKGPRSDLIVKPVDGNTYYRQYKCVATNRLGQAIHYMELRRASIPDVVPQAKPRIVTATSITFDIIPPAIEIGMPIRAFTGQWKEVRNPDWTYAKNRTWSPDSPYVVEGLKPDTRYNFRFAARNDVGLGTFGAYVEQGTPKRSEPEVPKVLHAPVEEESQEEGEDPIVLSPYADHFELRWNIPADNGEPIDYYKIKYCPVSWL